MKLTQLTSPLFVFSLFSTSLAARSLQPSSSLAVQTSTSDAGAYNTDVSRRGLADPPIDGKDGKPHAGPFVETGGDRDRKKEATQPDSEKSPTAKDPNSGSTNREADAKGNRIPETNDGVMSDKNRSGPKQGTTGTEGGVSEKSKEGSSGSEKVPDSPKEAPPLPHSEQEKIPEKSAASKTDDTLGSSNTVLAVNITSPC